MKSKLFKQLIVKTLLTGLVTLTSLSSNAIINGTVATIGEKTYQTVLIGHEGDEKWFSSCGGAILNDFWMITAAHCFSENPDATELSKLLIVSNPHTFTLRADSTISNIGAANTHPINKVISNPQYSHSATKFGDGADIALVRVSTPFPASLTRVKIPTYDFFDQNILEGTSLAISGFGLFTQGTGISPPSPTMQVGTMNLMSTKACRAERAPRLNRYSDTMDINENATICADARISQQTVCTGDSGGSLVYEQNNTFYTLGVLHSSTEGCSLERASFTMTMAKRNWILTHINGGTTNVVDPSCEHGFDRYTGKLFSGGNELISPDGNYYQTNTGAHTFKSIGGAIKTTLHKYNGTNWQVFGNSQTGSYQLNNSQAAGYYATEIKAENEVDYHVCLKAPFTNQ